MSPRSIRRAAERQQAKLARKAARQLEIRQPEPESSTSEPKISDARLAANQKNAQLSTGPTSPEGKAASSLNALKTALTGRTVLLPTDDAEAYEQHLANYDKDFKPMTPRECELVQSLADTAWRMQRIPALEMAIYAQGRIEFAEKFNDREPALRPSLIELETHLAYEKQLRNLQIQEARLHRRRQHDLAELRDMQQERHREEREQLADAAKLYTAAKHDNKPFNPEDFGFEFSIEDVEAYLEGVRAAHLLRTTLKQEAQSVQAHA
jgi:hypothetical protein